MTPAGGHVVFVLPTFLPESFGGAEQQTRKLALALSLRGLRATILAPKMARDTPQRESMGPTQVVRFSLRHAPNLGGRHLGSFLLWSIKVFWWLTRHRREYDVIHIIHGRLHALPAVLAGRVLRKPTLIKIGRGGREHFDIDVLRRKKILGPVYARLIMGGGHVAFVANSREIVADLQRWGVPAAAIHEIPNGVEIPPVVRHEAPAAAVRCVYLGRLDTEKSLDLMIEGIARLRDPARVSLVLVGEGRCRPELEALVSRLHLQATVRFAGATDDVSAALREADVFLSTSSSEGMSNALLEAMSFGLVPVVSRVSGVADIVDDDVAGLLFESASLSAFTQRLEELLLLAPADRQRMGGKAREAVASRFSMEAVADAHVAVYRQALCKNS